MKDLDIERIQNLPIEERKEALLDWISKMQADSPDTIAILEELPKIPPISDVYQHPHFEAAPMRQENFDKGYLVFGSPQPHWRKCSEEMPEIGINVLLRDGYDIVVASWSGRTWFCNCNCKEGSYAEGTHWMPLPEAPSD